jgi:phosphate starvation-inducible PhoH-like protein
MSGLRVVEGILDGIEDVSFNRLTAHDVVRHRLVGKIVEAYDAHDAAKHSDGRRDAHAERERR